MTANAIAPKRCENATGWRILMYARRDAPLNVTTVRNMHRSTCLLIYKRAHPHLVYRQFISTQQEVTSHQAHHQQWIRMEYLWNFDHYGDGGSRTVRIYYSTIYRTWYNVQRQKWNCIRKQTRSHSRGDAYKYASQFRAKAIELEQSQMK